MGKWLYGWNFSFLLHSLSLATRTFFVSGFFGFGFCSCKITAGGSFWGSRSVKEQLFYVLLFVFGIYGNDSRSYTYTYVIFSSLQKLWGWFDGWLAIIADKLRVDVKLMAFQRRCRRRMFRRVEISSIEGVELCAIFQTVSIKYFAFATVTIAC